MAFAGDVHFAERTADRLAANPATAFGVAAAELSAADLTMVNLETAIAVGGDSAGGNLAAQMAAVASEARLPKARAVVALMPGEVQTGLGPDLGRVPGDTLLVVAVAEDDRVVGDVAAADQPVADGSPD